MTGGGTRSFGINIYVTRERPASLGEPDRRGVTDRAAVLRALIGERPLRDAQLAVLERLDVGRNTLAVLGTGRGKSLCFQYPAAVRALERGQKTVVLYPLRALANDQYEALVRRLGAAGHPHPPRQRRDRRRRAQRAQRGARERRVGRHLRHARSSCSSTSTVSARRSRGRR